MIKIPTVLLRLARRHAVCGKNARYIVAVRPLKEGVIADYETTEKMLTYFIRKVVGKRLMFKPRIIVCVPTGATDVEERAVRQATLQAGARQAFLIEEPLAAAMGAGINISDPTGNMIVDVGGTTDIAVLSCWEALSAGVLSALEGIR